MLFGYARTSTAEQAAGFEAQRRELKEAGCKKVFGEQVSSVATRAKLEDAIDYIREGDVVTKLERRRATCTPSRPPGRSVKPPDVPVVRARARAKGPSSRS